MSEIFIMRRYLVATLVSLSTLFSSGCKATMQEVIVDKCGSDVRLKQGDALIVRLQSQMTAGYLWTAKPANDGVLILSGEPKIERKPSDLDGGSETQIFHFKTSKIGNTSLNFDYQHPWKSDKPPLKTCVFFVTVENANQAL